MKKGLFIIGWLLVGLTGGVWAQTKEAPKQSLFSLGIGGFASGDLGGGAKITGYTYEVSAHMGHFGGGVFVFFDAKYLETSLGYFLGGGDWEMKTNVPGVSDGKIGNLSLSSVNVGFLLKYPFVMNSTLKLFPALGVHYQAVLSAELDNVKNDNPEDLSAMWFYLGGGLDCNISKKLYARFEFLYGFRVKNNVEADYVDYMNYSFSGYPVKTEEIRGHGPCIKLALGINL